MTWPIPRQQSSAAFTPAHSPFVLAQHAIAVMDARALAASAARMERPTSAENARRTTERRRTKMILPRAARVNARPRSAVRTGLLIRQPGRSFAEFIDAL